MYYVKCVKLSDIHHHFRTVNVLGYRQVHPLSLTLFCLGDELGVTEMGWVVMFYGTFDELYLDKIISTLKRLEHPFLSLFSDFCPQRSIFFYFPLILQNRVNKFGRTL